MKIQIKNELIERFIWDLRKPEIDKVERANIILDYMAKHKLSGRGFALKFGFPKSTIEDWLLYSRLTKKELEELEDRGLSKKEIYKELRNNRGKQYKDFDMIEIRLNKIIDLLNTFPAKKKYNSEIQEKINTIRDLLSRLEISLR